MFKTKNFNWLHFFLAYKWKIVFTSLLNVLGLVSSLMIPLVLGKMISTLENKSATLTSLGQHFLSVILLYCIWNVLALVVEVNFEVLNKQLENTIRKHCIERLYYADFSSLLQLSESEIISRITRDSRAIDKAFINCYRYFFALLNTFIIIVMMIKVHLNMALVLLVIYLFVLFSQRITSASLKKQFSKFKKIEDAIFEQFHVHLKAIVSSKILQNESKLINKLDQSSHATLRAYQGLVRRVASVKYFNFTILGVFRSATIFIGGLFYLLARISLGSIFTLYTYVIQLASYLRTLLEVDILVKDMSASLSRLDVFLNDLSSPQRSYSYVIQEIKT